MGVDLVDWVKEALIHAQNRSANFTMLGRNDTEGNAFAANYCNEIIETLMDRNPRLAVTSTTLNVTQGTRTVALPAGLRGIDIIMLRAYNTGTNPFYDDQILDFLDTAGWRATPLDIQNGYWPVMYPYQYTLDENRTNIILPTPMVSDQLTIVYRVQPTAITGTNVAAALAGTSVPISYLPTTCLRAMALGLAWKVTMGTNVALSDRLFKLFDNPLPAPSERPGELQLLQERIMNVMASANNSKLYQSSWMDRDTDFGTMANIAAWPYA